MLVKWFEELSQYEFDVVHVRGAKNVVADGFNRMFESLSFNSMAIRHLVRDKTPPENEEHKMASVRSFW